MLILNHGLNTPPPGVTFRPISEPYVKSVSMMEMFPQRPRRRAGSALTGVNVPREREMRRGGRAVAILMKPMMTVAGYTDERSAQRKRLNWILCCSPTSEGERACALCFPLIYPGGTNREWDSFSSLICRGGPKLFLMNSLTLQHYSISSHVFVNWCTVSLNICFKIFMYFICILCLWQGDWPGFWSWWIQDTQRRHLIFD